MSKQRGINARFVKLSGGELQRYLWSNYCGVSDRDFPREQHIILRNAQNQDYVVFGVPTSMIPPGGFFLNEKQRLWTQVGQRDEVLLAPYDPSWQGPAFYIGSMEVVACYASVTSGTPGEAFREADLRDAMFRTCENQCLQPNQKILVDFRGAKFLFTVRSVALATLDKAASQQSATSDPRVRGILFRGSSITVTADTLDSRVAVRVISEKTGSSAGPIFKKEFKFSSLGIGGLDHQSDTIYRRVFLSRMVRPEIFKKFDMQHTRGMLLYGPPGTGKTLIARKIGELLAAHPPIIINGPEVLNKYVGQSEENIRKAFEPAEKEQKAKGDDSQLHVIIFDELDAVCKSRGSGVGGGTGVGDSIVNQLLTKLDGVEQLNNILLIGMTNRKDLIDEALMRPGRLEVHVEIGLPDEAGRVQILNIHTKALAESNSLAADVDLHEIASRTPKYSGAELQAVVKTAKGIAAQRYEASMAADQRAEKADNLSTITMKDFLSAIEQVPARFGNHEDELRRLFPRGITKFNPAAYDEAYEGVMLGARVARDPTIGQHVVIVHGPPGAGKSALAADLALKCGMAHIKVLSPSTLRNCATEIDKWTAIRDCFALTEGTGDCVLWIDNFEDILSYDPVDGEYSKLLLRVFLTTFRCMPPAGSARLILVTTSHLDFFYKRNVLEHSTLVPVPLIENLRELHAVLDSLGGYQSERMCRRIAEVIGTSSVRLGVKMVVDFAELAERRSLNDSDERSAFVTERLIAAMTRHGETSM